jgi:hypothetical protein
MNRLQVETRERGKRRLLVVGTTLFFAGNDEFNHQPTQAPEEV